MDNCGNSRANTCTKALTKPWQHGQGKGAFIRPRPMGTLRVVLVWGPVLVVGISSGITCSLDKYGDSG